MCDYKYLTDKKVPIALMHYPILAWNRYRHGSMMLHGHIHSTGEYNERNRVEGIRRYDVALTPITSILFLWMKYGNFLRLNKKELTYDFCYRRSSW